MTYSCSADPVRALFPEARCLGSTAWSLPLQNGHRHQTSVVLRDSIFVLTTPLQNILLSASQLAQINAYLPAACRTVCSLKGISLVAEVVCGRSSEAEIRRAVGWFEQGLDLIYGASVLNPDADGSHHLVVRHAEEASSDWQLTEGPNGIMVGKLPHKKGSLPVTVSASTGSVQILDLADHPVAVREAVAEVLLRSSSRVKFVRVCATESVDGKWAIWMEVPLNNCSTDEALAALALMCRDCGAEVGALTDRAVAGLYCRISSIWRDRGIVISNEERR